MTTHEMKLQPEIFNSIKNGTKQIESRLFDEKRQQIQLGDTIVFKNTTDLNDAVETQVIGLLRYPTFTSLFSDFEPSMFGGESAQGLEDQIYSFYSKEDEAKCGVLGIRIKTVR